MLPRSCAVGMVVCWCVVGSVLCWCVVGSVLVSVCCIWFVGNDHNVHAARQCMNSCMSLPATITCNIQAACLREHVPRTCTQDAMEGGPPGKGLSTSTSCSVSTSFATWPCGLRVTLVASKHACHVAHWLVAGRKRQASVDERNNKVNPSLMVGMPLRRHHTFSPQHTGDPHQAGGTHRPDH